MVKKLFKHELSDLLKYIKFSWLGLLGVSVLASISIYSLANYNYSAGTNFGIFDPQSMLQMFEQSSIALFFLAIVTVWILTYVIFIVRFYRSLLSNEGYLTHSLPFTTTKLFNVKLVCGALAFVIDFFVTLAAITVALLPAAISQDGVLDFLYAFELFFGEFFEDLGVGYGIVNIVLTLLLIIFALFQSILYPVVCMSLGQRFKNRILASVIIYIGIDWALQFVAAIGMFFFSIALSIEGNFLYDIANGRLAYTVTQLIIVAVLAGACALCYFISRHMLTKKLNLA